MRIMMKSALCAATLFAMTGVSAAEKAKPTLDIGGAVRLNYGIKDYDEASKKKNGDFDIDLVRIDIDATYEDWYLDAQHRWYVEQEFDTIHHAFVGFNHDKNNQIELGIHQVPFGPDPYVGNSFWFSGAYYLGFEDDYDAGIKWKHKGDGYKFDLGYYHSSELKPSNFKRYSFDVADETAANYYAAAGSTSAAANEEAGQINARFIKSLGGHEVGISGEFGRIYNNANEKRANRHAFSIHGIAALPNNWTVKAQGIQYAYDNTADIGTDDGTIALSGFKFASDIASEGRVGTLNISKKFNTKNRSADSVTCYNDFSHIKGTADTAAGKGVSMQNVVGCMLAKGGLYTYVDVVSGKNMYFIGAPGVAVGSADDWNTRLNVNIGWYF